MHGLLSYVADNLFSLNAAIQFTGGNFFFIFSNRLLKEKNLWYCLWWVFSLAKGTSKKENDCCASSLAHWNMKNIIITFSCVRIICKSHSILNAIAVASQNSFPILTCLFCGNNHTEMFQMFLRKNNKWNDLFLFYLTFLNLRYTNHSNNKEQ